MTVELELQLASEADEVPPKPDFLGWVEAALAGRRDQAELVIRVVDEPESRMLNRDYRGKDKPTNVLSFPFETPAGIPADEAGDYLGDLVICAPVVAAEAVAQDKPLQQHWAHMVVHGCLHLLGYDHQNDHEAEQMESLEREILAGLGLPDPYLCETES